MASCTASCPRIVNLSNLIAFVPLFYPTGRLLFENYGLAGGRFVIPSANPFIAEPSGLLSGRLGFVVTGFDRFRLIAAARLNLDATRLCLFALGELQPQNA